MKKFNLFFLLLFVASAMQAQLNFQISALVLTNNYQTVVPNHAVFVIDSASGANPTIAIHSFTTGPNGTFTDSITTAGNSGTLWFMAPDSCGFATIVMNYSTSSPSTLATAGLVLCNNTIAGGASCNYTVSATLVAGQPNMVFFNYANASPTASSFFWDFGDGNSSTQPAPFHTYAQPGTYYYCLTIDNCTAICDSVVVIPITGCDPYFVPIVNNNTVEVLPALINGQYFVMVDWGDNTMDTITPATITPNSFIHTYPTPGNYIICFTHSNSSIGCSNTYCDTVVVGSTTPLQCNASFIIDTVNSQPGTVYIWNTSTVPGFSPTTNVTYMWDFGDGTTSFQPFPTHNYQNPGSYSLCLTIAATDNNLSCTSVFCDSLTVDQNGNIVYKGVTIGWDLIVLDPTTIGVAESVLTNAKIYPNPVTDVLNISLPESTLKTEVSIYNVNGNLVKVVQMQDLESQIDVADLPAGMYILRLQSQNAGHQMKFVKY